VDFINALDPGQQILILMLARRRHDIISCVVLPEAAAN
jgi:hypothetical protein